MRSLSPGESYSEKCCGCLWLAQPERRAAHGQSAEWCADRAQKSAQPDHGLVPPELTAFRYPGSAQGNRSLMAAKGFWKRARYRAVHGVCLWCACAAASSSRHSEWTYSSVYSRPHPRPCSLEESALGFQAWTLHGGKVPLKSTSLRQPRRRNCALYSREATHHVCTVCRRGILVTVGLAKVQEAQGLLHFAYGIDRDLLGSTMDIDVSCL